MKMLKPLLTLFFLLTFTMIFTSCHKEYLVHEEKSLQADVSEKVNIWLDKQKLSGINAKDSVTNAKVNGTNTKVSGTNKNANIELLKQNLDFSAAKTEQRDKDFDFLIVPVKEELKTKKNLNKNSTLNVLFVMDKAGNIKWGNIVYFLPADGKKRDAFSSNTFQNIFNNKPVNDNGMFKFLSISGTWIYQLEYKNGKLYSNGIIKTNEVNGTQKTNSTCIDWYLVTTYHYSDGSSYQTSEYVGTTCDGCDNLNYESLCPGGDGGGGSGSNDDLVIADVTYEENEAYRDDEAGSGISPSPGSTASYMPIKYKYHAQVYYHLRTGYVETVVIDPMTADPMVSPFIDSYQRPGTRSLTLFGHLNAWSKPTPQTARVTWSCLVNGRYVCKDGTVWTHQWSAGATKFW